MNDAVPKDVTANNIVLIGYRGTGKSVIGRALAAALELNYVELDALIVARARCTIPELVASQGWDVFRAMESDVLRAVVATAGQVIDTGGGIIERSVNHPLLCNRNLVLWLKAPIATLQARLEGCTNRPALTSGSTTRDEIETVLARREPIYRALAQAEINTAADTPQELARALAALYRHWQSNGCLPPEPLLPPFVQTRLAATEQAGCATTARESQNTTTARDHQNTTAAPLEPARRIPKPENTP